MAIREARPAEDRRSLGEIKEMLKEQFLLVRLDEERAIATLPALLPRSVEKRRAALDLLHRMVAARGKLSEEGSRRLDRIQTLFEARPERQVNGPEARA